MDVVDSPRPYSITFVEHDQARKGLNRLAECAPESFLVVDEVHKTLHETQRTGAALQLCQLSLEFILLTGTPVIDSHTYKLMRWLQQCVPYEVNSRNFWVAATAMIARRVSTGVCVETQRIVAPFTSEERIQYREHAPPGLGGANARAGPHDIHRTMEIATAACVRKLRETVAESIRTTPEDGAFVVVRDIKQQELVRSELVRIGVSASAIECVSRHNAVNLTYDNRTTVSPKCRVVITTLAHSTGYTVTRFRRFFTTVMPTNEATREQLRGRINRIGQRSKTILNCTVVDAGGFWDAVLRRHAHPRNINDVLKHALAAHVSAL
jgi:hypothetical protein